MTRLVVHIGAQRTASPGFHKSLFDNAEALLQRGVLIPQSGRHDMSPHAVRHQLLAWSFGPDGDHPYDPRVWQTLADELAASPAHTALVSSELLGAVAADAVTAPQLMERLRMVSDDVTVVFFARDQLDLLNSLYCQQVRALELTCDFEEYVATSADLDHYDLASLALWYGAADVDFRSLPWDPNAGAEALPALLTVAGIDVDEDTLVTPELDTEADQLGPVGVEANRLLGGYLRGRFPDFRPGAAATRRLRRKAALAGQGHGFDDDDFWGWSPELAAKAAARYAETNKEFARHTWGGEWGLAAPVEKPRHTVDLVELEPTVVNRVHRYLIDMEDTFERFRRREASA